MSTSFKVAMVGPSSVGKTTLLTAILAETQDMLAGTPVTISKEEPTEARVGRNRRDLRRAIEAGEFDAGALGSTQSMFLYEVALEPAGDASMRIPFSVLDYPGRWFNAEARAAVPEARETWPACIEHIRNSIMLLVPIDSAVLMEAATPRQKGAVADLLGFEDVEAVAREWAMARNQVSDEPAVLVLAPLKCEKYFDDNGGDGRDAGRLRAKVREKYQLLIDIVRAEVTRRPLRVLYAPVDTYGCVELMEANWLDRGGRYDMVAHYRFRGAPPRVRVKAAGTVMQELCRCIISGRDSQEAAREQQLQQRHLALARRKQEAKGFWGTLDYYLSGEAGENRDERDRSVRDIAATNQRRAHLQAALEKLAVTAYDPRVEEW